MPKFRTEIIKKAHIDGDAIEFIEFFFLGKDQEKADLMCLASAFYRMINEKGLADFIFNHGVVGLCLVWKKADSGDLWMLVDLSQNITAMVEKYNAGTYTEDRDAS